MRDSRRQHPCRTRVLSGQTSVSKKHHTTEVSPLHLFVGRGSPPPSCPQERERVWRRVCPPVPLSCPAAAARPAAGAPPRWACSGAKPLLRGRLRRDSPPAGRAGGRARSGRARRAGGTGGRRRRSRSGRPHVTFPGRVFTWR